MPKEVLSTTQARQGNRRFMNMRVLLVSTLIAFAVLAMLYFAFWPWPDPNTGPADKPAATESAPEGPRPPAGIAPGRQPPAQQ